MTDLDPRIHHLRRPQHFIFLTLALLAALATAAGAQSPTPEAGQTGHLYAVEGWIADAGAVVEWRTGPEAGSVSFRLERVRGRDSVPVHREWLAPSSLRPAPTTYRVLDRAATIGGRGRYVLVERSIYGGEMRVHGPFDLRFERPLAGDPEFTPPVQVFESSPEAPLDDTTEDVIPDDTVSTTVAKVRVSQSGLYRLPAADLAAALGQSVRRIETQIERGTLGVRNRGQEVAWTSSADGSAILFFAEAFDSFYTVENVYWIELGAATPRIDTAPAVAPQPAPGGFFESEARSEEDAIAAISVTKFEGVDFWYWDGVRAESDVDNVKTFPLRSPDVASAGGSAALTVRLAGATKGSGYNNHHAVISVNGTEIGDIYFIGLLTTEQTLTFDAALLAEDNIVQVEGVLDNGAIGSAFFVDWFELDYPRFYRAEGGSLLLRGEANAVVTVDNLPGTDVVVLDLGTPSTPVRLTDLLVEPDGLGQTRVSFSPADGSTPHLVATESTALAVDAVEADSVRSNPTVFLSGGDYVIITPEALIEPAGRLAELREQDGLVPYLLTLEDLYDSFSGGVVDPWAVRSFLSFAHANWSTVPRYVVLVGTGTYDPKDYLGVGDNLMPTVFAATPYGMAAADNLMADIDGDRIVDFAIGRIPVRTVAEFHVYVDKVEAFESASGAWLNEALMLADDPDYAGDFTTQSETAASHLPETMVVERVYLEHLEIGAARAQLLAALNSGRRVTNYIGHGGVEILAYEEMLTTADVPTLEDSGVASVVSALTCVAGRFEYPGLDSVSEAMVKARDGGAVTLWAPTSPSMSGAALGLNTDYFDHLFEPGQRVGDAVLEAIRAAGPSTLSFLLETYTLMGDPAVRVQ